MKLNRSLLALYDGDSGDSDGIQIVLNLSITALICLIMVAIASCNSQDVDPLLIKHGPLPPIPNVNF